MRQLILTFYENKKITLKLHEDQNLVQYSGCQVSAGRSLDQARIIGLENGTTVSELFIGNQLCDLVESYFSDGGVSLKVKGSTFKNTFGHVQFTVVVKDHNNNIKRYCSDYLAVKLKKADLDNDMQKNLQSMLLEVSQKAQELALFKNAGSIAGLRERPDIENHLYPKLILEKARRVLEKYQQYFSYFKANCRYKTEQQMRVDNVEKLQYLNPQTVQHFCQHGEHLQPHRHGVRSGRRRYLPRKTLMAQRVISKDIQENRLILSFLYHMKVELNDVLESTTKAFIKTKSHSELVDFLRYADHVYVEQLKKEAAELFKQANILFDHYQAVFNIPYSKRLDSLPRPTKIFSQVREYQAIYRVMKDWFDVGGNDLLLEEQLTYPCPILNTCDLYEAYILSNLLENVRHHDYQEVKRNLYAYDDEGRKMSNTYTANTFIYQKAQNRLTVYFQPVIEGRKHREKTNEIGLVRVSPYKYHYTPKRNTKDHSLKNNIIPTDKMYYTPDYLIKYENLARATTSYTFLDAKFSSMQDVLNYQKEELLFKYLLSVNVLNPLNSVVNGLVILTGKDKEQKTDDFYQHALLPVKPSYDIFTFNCLMTPADRKAYLDAIFKGITADLF